MRIRGAAARIITSWTERAIAGLLALTLGVVLTASPGQGGRAAPAAASGEMAAPGVEAALADVVVPRLIEVAAAAPAALDPEDPAQMGLEPSRLKQAADAVRREIRRGATPGAALVVGRGGRIAMARGFGSTDRRGTPVEPERTLYDLASLTKVIATTTAVMLLVEDGAMELDAPVSAYLPEFTGGSKHRVTVRHLLTHTSGLPAGMSMVGRTPEARLRRVISVPLRERPGRRVVYSDLGPVILWAAAERVAAEPLEDLLRRRIFRPLGMTSTGFRPDRPCHDCAPTASGIRGRVHDPIAYRLGGVAGNAGLFATATDVARFAAMLAGSGELNGVRVLEESTVADFTRRQPGAGTRALGWDTPSPRGRGAAGRYISRGSFGHTGFTGTSLWVDPERDTWTVLLANRTYQPRARNRIQALRRAVNDQVSRAAHAR